MNAVSTELTLRAQVTHLRAALARIEGSARYGAKHGGSTADRASFTWIAEEAKEALEEAASIEDFQREEADYVAWRATQPAPMTKIPEDLPL